MLKFIAGLAANLASEVFKDVAFKKKLFPYDDQMKDIVNPPPARVPGAAFTSSPKQMASDFGYDDDFDDHLPQRHPSSKPIQNYDEADQWARDIGYQSYDQYSDSHDYDD